jgi:hypothetical protein
MAYLPRLSLGQDAPSRTPILAFKPERIEGRRDSERSSQPAMDAGGPAQSSTHFKRSFPKARQ